MFGQAERREEHRSQRSDEARHRLDAAFDRDALLRRLCGRDVDGVIIPTARRGQEPILEPLLVAIDIQGTTMRS
jgi:hypothetical protein